MPIASSSVVFAAVIFRHFLGPPIAFSDLEFFDREIYNGMKWIRDNYGVDALGLDFKVMPETLNGWKVLELTLDGGSIPLTDDNKMEYLNLRMK
jgi:E3 ubiquitin ligase SMURF1/2/E3 ubiquitin-protein ligase NEDD4